MLDERRTAEQVEEPPTRDRGLITIRMENILTWADFIKLDRGSEADDDPKDADDTLKEMDRVSVSRDRRANAAKLRFDLDLPAAAEDDLPLSEGILLPEWDYRTQRLQADHCRLIPLLSAQARSIPLPGRF